LADDLSFKNKVRCLVFLKESSRVGLGLDYQGKYEKIAHVEMIRLNEMCFIPLEILVKYFVLNCG
jgi:hypothetical protein